MQVLAIWEMDIPQKKPEICRGKNTPKYICRPSDMDLRHNKWQLRGKKIGNKKLYALWDKNASTKWKQKYTEKKSVSPLRQIACQLKSISIPWSFIVESKSKSPPMNNRSPAKEIILCCKWWWRWWRYKYSYKAWPPSPFILCSKLRSFVILTHCRDFFCRGPHKTSESRENPKISKLKFTL